MEFKDVLEARSNDPELPRGIISALGWLSYAQAERFIQSYLNSGSAARGCSNRVSIDETGPTAF
jgi:hypothetical protein